MPQAISQGPRGRAVADSSNLFAPDPVEASNAHRPIGSIDRVGTAGDNTAMDSFFALLQKNVLDRRRWRTREERSIASIR